jgi:hypothetical protein
MLGKTISRFPFPVLDTPFPVTGFQRETQNGKIGIKFCSLHVFYAV